MVKRIALIAWGIITWAWLIFILGMIILYPPHGHDWTIALPVLASGVFGVLVFAKVVGGLSNETHRRDRG